LKNLNLNIKYNIYNKIMGTRALIGYLDTDQKPSILTTTTNQFDGYYEQRFINKDGEEEIIPGLGFNLNKFYNSDSKAEEIANMGYISYVDSETGEGVNNSTSTSQPEKIKLTDNFNEAMMEIAIEIDRGGRNYGYIWDNENEEWITIKNNGIGRMTKDLEMNLAHLKEKFTMMPERPDQTMNENKSEEEDVFRDWISDMLKYKSYDEVVKTVNRYLKDALMDDELVAKVKAEKNKKPTPEIPGFEGTQDALDNLFEEEYQKRQWQHRAGIIK